MDVNVHITGFGQMFGVPNLVVDQYLKLATPSQLKVLLYLLRHNCQSVDLQEIAKAIAISEEIVEEALLFWSQTDLFAASADTSLSSTTNEVQETNEHIDNSIVANNETESPAPTASNRNSRRHAVALSSGKACELSPLEITAALEASSDLKTLFQMSEQQLGRPLRHIEQKALVWMHDYNMIGSDIILTVLLYCKSIDKPSVSYAESIITAWWNDGIQTLAQVNHAINEMEHRRSFTGHIQKSFEMARRPTPKQQEFIDKWQDKNIPLDLITYAYEKTLENIDKLSFPYLDSILMSWMQAGYRTRTDVDAHDYPTTVEKKKSADKSGKSESENADAYQSFYYNLHKDV